MPANIKVLAATKKKPDRSKKIAKKKIPSQRKLCLYPTSKVEEALVAVQNGMFTIAGQQKVLCTSYNSTTRKKGRLSTQKIVKLKNKDFFSNMMLSFMSYVFIHVLSLLSNFI